MEEVVVKSVLIIINNKDDAEYLPDVLDSIVGQINQDFSIVGIDAGSKDESADIYNQYDVPVVDCTGLNQAQSVNKVLRMTDEPFIGWINADDIYKENYISSHLYEFKDPTVGIVYSDYDIFWQEFPARRKIRTRIGNIDKLFKEGKNPIAHPTVMIRRSVFDRIGLLDESLTYVIDYEFWLRAWKNNVKFKHIVYSTAEFRVRKDSLTNTRRECILAEMKQVQRRYLGG